MNKDNLALLKLYLSDKALTQTDIANVLGVSKQYVNSLLTGSRPFGKKQAKIWEDKFGVSCAWLLTGKGEMLKPNGNDDMSNARMMVGVFSAGQFDEGVIMVDFVPVSATATFIENLSSGDDLNLDKYPLIPAGNEKYEIDSLNVFEVHGDSMYPTIASGSLILAKEIPERTWHYAEGVVVAVFSEYVVVKRIARNCLLTENYMILSSDNEGYGDMTVALSDLRKLYKAKRIISQRIS